MDFLLKYRWHGKTQMPSYAFLHSNPSLKSIAGYGAALLFLVFYLVQHMTISPNASDGGLILGYIHQISRGKLPGWDFIDVYGPVNWICPVLFYSITGNEVWGIRIWLVTLKLFSVGMTYILVYRLGNFFYAVLAACWSTVLLGLPWQYLQTNYAFHTTFPLMLLAWYLLVCSPFKAKSFNVLSAACVTSIIIWTKLNTGLFLFAGGLFFCFYWIPGFEQNRDGALGSSFMKIVYLVIQITGILLFGAVFLMYIQEYFNKMYFNYLALPLTIGLLLTLKKVRQDERDGLLLSNRLKPWFFYLSATALFSVLLPICYFGPNGLKNYWVEIISVLSHLDYASPFPLLGEQGHYKGFNEYYWLQLPWLVTVVFCAWLWLKDVDARGANAFRRKWHTWRDNTVGMWLLFTFSVFAIYSRSDETHIFQSVLPAVPVLFILLFQIESFLTFKRIMYLRAIRVAMMIAIGISVSTLMTVPSISALNWSDGMWHNKSLRFIDIKHPNPLFPPDVNIMPNQAAAYIDEITEDDTVVLVLNDNLLLNFNSHTMPVGGRYQYLFFLLANKLIDRDAFDILVPSHILENILTNPPEVMVGGHTHSPMFAHFPEFEILLNENYIETKRFGSLSVYTLDKTK